MNTFQDNDNNDITSEENQNYRNNYYRVMRSIKLLSILAVVLILILMSLALTEKKRNYYATTASGQVIPMYALSAPMVTNAYLLQWASLATRTAFNLDWVNWQKQLDQVNSDFTKNGWEQFKKALNQSGLLDTIRNQKLQMTAVVSSAAIITGTAIIKGRFTWRLQLPVLITFVSASETVQSHWLITMNVQRTSTLDAYKGIQINNFVAAPKL